MVDMGKTGQIIARNTLKVISFPFVVILEMSKGVFDQPNKTASRYWKGMPTRTLRPESYRTLKRRNRLMRKYSHKNDKDR
jgi:hypothetical protein